MVCCLAGGKFYMINHYNYIRFLAIHSDFVSRITREVGYFRVAGRSDGIMSSTQTGREGGDPSTDGDVIPVDVRWKFAARMLTSLPLAYNWALRDVIGAAFPHLERAIMRETAVCAFEVAKSYNPPSSTAKDVAETFILISSVVFGPEFSRAHVTGSNNSAHLRISACPLCETAKKMDIEPERAHSICNSFCSAAVEMINPRFTLDCLKSICQGDNTCEIAIRLRG